jgi:hypothetical protein
MKKSRKASIVLDPLQELFDLYNAGKVPKSQFIEKVIPLLQDHRRQQIYYHLGQLVLNDAARYHVSSPHHHQLWGDAEAAYDAALRAKLALQPGQREKLDSFQFSEPGMT